MNFTNLTLVSVKFKPYFTFELFYIAFSEPFSGCDVCKGPTVTFSCLFPSNCGSGGELTLL